MKLKAQLLIYLIVTLSVLCPDGVFAQCTNDNNFERTLPVPPCGVDSTVRMGAGTYVEVPVVAGLSYTFSTCGATPFNSQLTGFNGSDPTAVFFNYDSGPECVGPDASVNWTASFTGMLRVALDVFNCDPCNAPFGAVPTDCPSLSSAVLIYRQDNNLSITSSDAVICSGQTRDLTATPAGGTFSGVGVTDSLFTAPDSNTSFNITYSFGQCAVSQTIDVNKSPTVIIVGDSALCPGASAILTADAVAGSGAIASYHWRRGSTTVGANSPTLTINQTGNYTVEVTNSNGCTAVSPVKTITDFQNPSVTIIGDSSLCAGDTTRLIALANAGSGTVASYQWKLNGGNVGMNDSIYYAAQEGSYTVEVTNSRGCSVESLPFVVTELPLPAVFALGENVTCNGLDNGVARVAVLSGKPPFSFSWNNGSSDSIATSLSSGSYKVTVTDANGCSVVSNAVLITEPPRLLMDVTDSVDATCGRKNGSLSAEGAAGVPPYLYSLNGGAFYPTGNFQNLPAATYNALVQDANGCQAIATVVIENFGTMPDATIYSDPDDIFCPGDSIRLSVESGADEYEWSTGDGGSAIWVNLPGNYSITVTNVNTCIDTTSIVVSSHDSLKIAVSGDTTINAGFSTPLSVTGGETYSWLPNESLDDPFSSQPVATPEETTVYTVTATDANGCQAVDSVTVTVDEQFSENSLVAPNLFTPNGDGHNDTWQVKNIEFYPECEVTVFNRWGTEVFSARNYNNDWDGTKDGKALADGTYYFVIRCEGSEVVYKGAITLLR